MWIGIRLEAKINGTSPLLSVKKAKVISEVRTKFYKATATTS